MSQSQGKTGVAPFATEPASHRRKSRQMVFCGVYSPSRSRRELPGQHESPCGFSEDSEKLTLESPG